MTPDTPGPRTVDYSEIDAAEIMEDGSLRLFRRRGPFRILRRQDIFHSRGEWESFTLNFGHHCTVRLWR
ncbi:MAG TPA: hypothetical protein VD948_01510 [Rhodothermales bacterium]|nr:hypothetical protein [Rhodothermales bacterium]